jgi:hypothetical protein
MNSFTAEILNDRMLLADEHGNPQPIDTELRNTLELVAEFLRR